MSRTRIRGLCKKETDFRWLQQQIEGHNNEINHLWMLKALDLPPGKSCPSSGRVLEARPKAGLDRKQNQGADHRNAMSSPSPTSTWPMKI